MNMMAGDDGAAVTDDADDGDVIEDVDENNHDGR